MGINYGWVGDNLLIFLGVVKIIFSLGIIRVRFFDLDVVILLVFGGLGFEVVIGMGNDVIFFFIDFVVVD